MKRKFWKEANVKISCYLPSRIRLYLGTVLCFLNKINLNIVNKWSNGLQSLRCVLGLDTFLCHPNICIQYISLYCSLYIFYGVCRENLSNNQELLEFPIISLILLNSMFDLGVILLGEIRCLSLLGVKGLPAKPFNRLKWLASKFSIQDHPWINFEVIGIKEMIN